MGRRIIIGARAIGLALRSRQQTHAITSGAGCGKREHDLDSRVLGGPSQQGPPGT
jgi:hypothetical protein